MNRFKKFCPNVWVAECDEKHEKGEVIVLETQHGKLVECQVYNLIKHNQKYYYSIVKQEEKNYAQRQAERYEKSIANHKAKSNDYYKASQENHDFLVLGQPIQVGHHSEAAHRKMYEKNWNRMKKSVEFAEKAEAAKEKAEYWSSKATEITLAMPCSIDYFSNLLEEAISYHKGLKDGSIEREHAYSLTYANKKVKELSKKLEIAKLLWGNNEEQSDENKD